jgi:hypothetical protein
VQLLQLVNTSGHFGNSYHSPLPIHDVRLNLPYTGEQPTSVRALYTGQEVAFASSAGQLSLNLPILGNFEVLRIDQQEK